MWSGPEIWKCLNCLRLGRRSSILKLHTSEYRERALTNWKKLCNKWMFGYWVITGQGIIKGLEKWGRGFTKEISLNREGLKLNLEDKIITLEALNYNHDGDTATGDMGNCAVGLFDQFQDDKIDALLTCVRRKLMMDGRVWLIGELVRYFGGQDTLFMDSHLPSQSSEKDERIWADDDYCKNDHRVLDCKVGRRKVWKIASYCLIVEMMKVETLGGEFAWSFRI